MRDRGQRSPQRALIFLAVLVLLAAGIYFAGRMIEGDQAPEQRSEMTEGFGRYEEKIHRGKTYYKKTNLTTVLLMGIDRDLTKPQEGFRDGGQSDLMILLVIDHEGKTVRQLQIERDTIARIHVLTITGQDGGYRDLQICLSHGYGANQTDCALNAVEAVGHYLDNLDVDLYIQTDYASVNTINDLLGGVTVTMEDDFSALDPEMALGKTLKLHGKQAELYVRSRMNVADGTNANRQIRQRKWLSGALELMEAKARTDSGFIGRMMDALGPRLMTNAARGRLINEFNAAIGYKRLPMEQIPGEYGVGRGDFVEDHTSPEDVTSWVLDAMYRPAEE